MYFRDFIFSYIHSLCNEFWKKKYLKFFKKLFYYPYKFILDKIRQQFLIDKINLDINYDDIKNKNLSLEELFHRYNTDKGKTFFYENKKFVGHDYTPFYEKYFKKFKSVEKLNILEVGSLRGAATASFYYYFDKPQIFCADLNPFQIRVFSKNIRKFYLDTQSKKTISKLANYINQKFDIIIDDGSHNIRDQIITFNIFFKYLKRSGIYVIEDASQYLVSKNLNQDNLKYGAKEILVSVKNNDFKKNDYLGAMDVASLNKDIKDVHIEKGHHIIKDINISEIIFIEKN